MQSADEEALTLTRLPATLFMEFTVMVPKIFFKRLLATACLGLAAHAAFAAGISPDQMPANLEVQFALSALPIAMRGEATVYILDPKSGYQLFRQGSNGIACLVERTVWEWAEYRDDVFIPLCYDAAGRDAHFKAIMDAAGLRAQGVTAAVLRNEVLQRYATKQYAAPAKAGLSYMIAPVMRALGPPDMKMHTMAMPHLMYYAPDISDRDIGALPDFHNPATLLYPFIDKQGIAEQSYMIQLIGAAEKDRILHDEASLLKQLCSYREILCLPEHSSH
jgi:hypothetical protein